MLHKRVLNGSDIVELVLSGLEHASNLAIGRRSSVLGILFALPQLEHGFLELFYRTTALLRAITHHTLPLSRTRPHVTTVACQLRG